MTSIIFFAASSIAAGDGEQITLDQILARADRWAASIVNLRIVYDHLSLPATNSPLVDWLAPPEHCDSLMLFARSEWIWADYDRLDLFEERSFYWFPGKIGYRTIHVFNGLKGETFHASYQKSPDEVEQLKELKLASWGGEKVINSIRAPLLGLYWGESGEWLPEVLAKWDWKVEGMEAILGEPCVRIATEHIVGTHPRLEILWLDLAHDFIPRRYQIPPTPSRKTGSDFVVDEVQQLEGGLWFPKRARLQYQTDPITNRLIVVTEARVNQTLDLTRFDPPIPVKGTIVSDKRIRPTEPPSATSPQLTSGWMIAIIGTAAILLAADLWLRKKGAEK